MTSEQAILMVPRVGAKGLDVNEEAGGFGGSWVRGSKQGERGKSEKMTEIWSQSPDQSTPECHTHLQILLSGTFVV